MEMSEGEYEMRFEDPPDPEDEGDGQQSPGAAGSEQGREITEWQAIAGIDEAAISELSAELAEITGLPIEIVGEHLRVSLDNAQVRTAKNERREER